MILSIDTLVRNIKPDITLQMLKQDYMVFKPLFYKKHLEQYKKTKDKQKFYQKELKTFFKYVNMKYLNTSYNK